MDIIEFWKQYITGRTNFQYDRDDFLQALTTNVPDWKEQVRNREIWPDLHSQGNYVNETICTDVIIEGAGLEFACYLVETGGRCLDSVVALSFCVKHISTDWGSFPMIIKEKILSYRLKDFLDECREIPSLWADLEKELKAKVLNEVESSEKLYTSDFLLYNLWSSELNYRNTPYLKFATTEFKQLKEEILRHQDDGMHHERRLERWNMPVISVVLNSLRYQPSTKLNDIKEVATLAADNDTVSFVTSLKNNIRHFVEMDW